MLTPDIIFRPLKEKNADLSRDFNYFQHKLFTSCWQNCAHRTESGYNRHAQHLAHFLVIFKVSLFQIVRCQYQASNEIPESALSKFNLQQV